MTVATAISESWTSFDGPALPLMRFSDPLPETRSFVLTRERVNKMENMFRVLLYQSASVCIAFQSNLMFAPLFALLVSICGCVFEYVGKRKESYSVPRGSGPCPFSSLVRPRVLPGQARPAWFGRELVAVQTLDVGSPCYDVS